MGVRKKKCEICGRYFQSLGYARHMAKHRDDRRRAQLEKLLADDEKSQEIACPKCGASEWCTDGMHTNEFCAKCFTTKPDRNPGKNKAGVV